MYLACMIKDIILFQDIFDFLFKIALSMGSQKYCLYCGHFFVDYVNLC